MINKKRGFTLIELLVVIAIIALLMAVLMPALNKVREQAKKVKCQAQMRQYGIAINMYSNDNNGGLPFFTPGFIGGGVVDSNTMWYGVVGRYMNITGATGKKNVQQQTVAQVANVRRCPSGKRNTDPAYAGFDAWKGWIGVNYGAWNYAGFPAPAPIVYGGGYAGAGSKCDPVQLSAIKKPADWVMLLDVQQSFVYTPALAGWGFDDDQDGDGKLDTCGGTNLMYNGANPKVHNNGCNVTLVDGHVEWIPFNEFWAYESSGKMIHSFWYNEKF